MLSRINILRNYRLSRSRYKYNICIICRWKYSFLKSKLYWQKFCDDEEKKLVRVRHSFPKSSYFPIISELSDSETDFRDIVDFSNLISASRSFDENVPLLDSKSSFPEAPDVFSRGGNGRDTRPNAEPIVKISPPTPLKTLPKDNAITITRTNAEEEREHAILVAENKSTIKKVILLGDSKSLDAPAKNSITPHDGFADRRVYSKGTCPFHKYEPAVKIFDDDIEKYLRDDPRASVWPEQNLNKLPILRDVSKYNRIKSKITFAKTKRTKKVNFSRNKRYYPDNAADLTKISRIESGNKENGMSDKEHDFKSDIFIADLNFSLGKKLTKRRKTAKNLKIASFPKLFQPETGIKATLDKLLTKSQEYLQAPKIHEKLVNKSE